MLGLVSRRFCGREEGALSCSPYSVAVAGSMPSACGKVPDPDQAVLSAIGIAGPEGLLLSHHAVRLPYMLPAWIFPGIKLQGGLHGRT